MTASAPSGAALLAAARAAAEAVPDPELPMLTLGDLGVLRDVRVEGGTTVVTITPTYSGCPATATMRADLLVALRRAGVGAAEVRTRLAPAWSTDLITERGRRRLAEAGIVPPGPAPVRAPGPVPLTLMPRPDAAACPRCGSTATTLTSRFASTPCTARHVCGACSEPFDAVKPL